MLFMGQEFASSKPFLYFADHGRDLADLVHRGRKEFLQQFRSLATPEMQDEMPRPDDPRDLRALQARLRRARDPRRDLSALHTTCCACAARTRCCGCAAAASVDGAVLGRDAFVLRFFGEDEDRLLLVNLDARTRISIRRRSRCWHRRRACTWEVLWSSEDPLYGGTGTPPVYSEDNWHLPGQSTILMQPKRQPDSKMAAPMPPIVERRTE